MVIRYDAIANIIWHPAGRGLLHDLSKLARIIYTIQTAIKCVAPYAVTVSPRVHLLTWKERCNPAIADYLWTLRADRISTALVDTSDMHAYAMNGRNFILVVPHTNELGMVPYIVLATFPMPLTIDLYRELVNKAITSRQI